MIESRAQLNENINDIKNYFNRSTRKKWAENIGNGSQDGMFEIEVSERVQ